MSENSSKNPDLNHLKVLLLNPQVFASDAAMERCFLFLKKKTDAAWNTYVLLTEEPMQEIFHRETAVAGMYGNLSGRSAGRVGTCEDTFFCDSWVQLNAAVL